MITGQASAQNQAETLEQPTKGKDISTQCPFKPSEFQEFKTFGVNGLSDMVEESVLLLNDMAANTSPRWLSLLGNSGIGKTMLAKKIYSLTSGLVKPEQYFPRLDDYRGGRQFVDWRVFLGKLKSGKADINAEITAINHRGFVVIDDLGTDLDKRDLSFGADVVDQILAGRSGKWTLLTCNKLLDKIAVDIDIRVASRMRRGGNKVVQVNCLDYSLRPQ